MMPEMDGPQTLAALRALPVCATTPVIFMTARAQRHEVEYYRGFGALGVIIKPFDPMVLCDTVQQIWSNR